jgi:hypothetical protein
MIPEYFKGGFMDAQVSKYYEWPGFFILVRSFMLVTGLPQASFDLLYHSVSGILLSSSIFLIAERRGMHSFWAVVVYSITAYYFLNYQFVPQTLGLVFVMILLQRDFSAPSPRSSIITLILVLGLALVHAFVGVFYVIYLAVMGVRNRAYLRKALLAGTTLVTVNVFFTAVTLAPLAAYLFKSLALLVGLSEYSLRASVTAQLTSPFQEMSRMSVLIAGLVGMVGLLGLLKRRQLTARDIAIAISVAIWMLLGVAIPVIGLRGLQLAAIVAALGAGYMPRLLTGRRLRIFVLVFLAVSSVFIVLHANYEPYLYQPQNDTSAALFLSSKISYTSEGRSVQVFSPFTLRGFFPGFGFGDEFGDTWTDDEYASTGGSPTSLDFALVTAVSSGYLRIRGLTFPPAVNHLVSTGNLVVHYGDGMVYANPWPLTSKVAQAEKSGPQQSKIGPASEPKSCCDSSPGRPAPVVVSEQVKYRCPEQRCLV